MKNERDLFEEWHNSIYCEKLEFSNDKQEYVDTFDQSTWEAWQASAQRDGYKLVPLQPSNNTIVVIERKVENQLEASGINADPFRLDGEKIYKAMIGAAE